MLLGDRLDGAYSTWRVVEDDLHHIARRVREYDDKARLIRQDGTGTIGIARYVEPGYGLVPGLHFAREVVDLTTDRPLTFPDGRVLSFMRAADAWRIRSMREWQRRSMLAEIAREEREDQRVYEEHYDPAERFVHALRKDNNSTPFAAIPKAVSS